jgi:hypothetical protein
MMVSGLRRSANECPHLGEMAGFDGVSSGNFFNLKNISRARFRRARVKQSRADA